MHQPQPWPSWRRRFFTFSALNFARFDAAVWILFLRGRGLSLAAVGGAEVAYHVAGLLAQVPTGLFADRRGRAVAMTVGCAVGAVGSLLLLTVHGALAAAAVIALSSLGATFVAGADRGLLYARLAEDGRQGSYREAAGRLLAVEDATGTVASALGGWLAGVSWTLVMGARAIVLMGAGTLATQLGGTPPPPVPLRAAASAALRSRPLRRLTLYAAGYAALTTTAHLWAQVLLADKGASLAAVGASLAATQLASSAGGLLAPRLRLGSRAFAWTPVLLAVTWAGAALAPTALLALGAILPGFLVEGIFYPQMETAVQRHAPEALRASVLSAQSALFSLAMIGLFPLFGALLDHLGPHAYLLLLPPWLALAGASRWIAGDTTEEPAAS